MVQSSGALPVMPATRVETTGAHEGSGRRGRWLAAGALVLAAAGVAGYVAAHRGIVSTDDAQVEGDVVDVAPRISGKVARLAVTDDQTVRAGDLIVSLETDQLSQQLGSAQADHDAAKAQLETARAQLALTEKNIAASLAQASGGVALTSGNLAASRASLEQAQAAVKAAKSKLDLATLELSRSRALLATRAVQEDEVDTRQNVLDASQAEYDAAVASLIARQAAIAGAEGDVVTAGGRLDAARTGPEQLASARASVGLAEAKLAQTESALELAKLNLSYAEVRAPVPGQVTRRAVQLGQMVTPDVALLSLVPLEHVWVVANFKEDQVARMRAGCPAKVTFDTYGSRTFAAHVDTLGATSGARLSLLPPENASGNFVKVVQRIPVRLVLDAPAGVPLRPGMSADVDVDVR
jgi:membrane fusion protein (multidrug efflux system)